MKHFRAGSPPIGDGQKFIPDVQPGIFEKCLALKKKNIYEMIDG